MDEKPKSRLVSDWLLDAPEEWRDEAIVNWMAQIMWPVEGEGVWSEFKLLANNEEREYALLYKVLGNAFLWQNTPQGYKYWDEIYDSI